MNMELIQSAASDALVNVVLAVIALAGAYAVYYIRLGAAKLKEQTAQIKDEAGRKVLEDALDDVVNLATVSVGAMEQTTAKALRDAVKSGKASREELLALGKQVFDEVKAAISPQAQKVITDNLGSFDKYLTAVIEDAVLKVIAGPEKRSLVNIERDRRITAIHEAGHAVAAYFLPTQEPVHQITIVPRGNALGLTISLPDQDTLHTTRNEMRDRIVVLLGGRVAEQLEFDDISTGASNDLQRATKLAHDMIAKYGMNERIGAVAYDDDSEIFVGRDYERTRSYSEQTAAEIDAEVRKTVDQAYAHCTQILTEHHEKLQEIAQWLLEHETMSRSQFEACMQALPIPEKQEGLLAGEEKTDGAEED